MGMEYINDGLDEETDTDTYWFIYTDQKQHSKNWVVFTLLTSYKLVKQ